MATRLLTRDEQRDILNKCWADAYRDYPDIDGVSLFSAAHPRSPWYRRLWDWVYRLGRSPRFSLDSLETIEINMNDNEIEQEIIAKGKTAPRVTLQDIEATIAYEYYITGGDIRQATTVVLKHPSDADHWKSMDCLTLCVLVLRNGFTATGESAPASPENFDAELGRKVARQNAVNKIWLLEGYLLKERLHRDAINRSSGGGDFGDS